ncbi:MAG: hypothetical protein PHI35_07390 [Victivallaceae bacterium]|nr:hypothetical protein [Victivallaceae bacterium]
MRHISTIAMFLVLSVLPLRGDELTASAFLDRARNPNQVSTYAALDGSVQHMRRGESPVTKQLYFALFITRERMTGEILLDGRTGYLIGQRRSGGDGSTTVSALPGNPADGRDELGWMGVRASDLAMSFLFYPLVRELPGERVSVVGCRVLLLASRDKKEFVRVYIAREHFFPLKAEFFDGEPTSDSTPVRTLECAGFSQKNDLYYAKSIRLSGPGWRTRIEFDGDGARLGLLDPASPPDIIRKPLSTQE